MIEPLGILNTSWQTNTPPSTIIEDIRKAVEIVESQSLDYCGSETSPHVVSPNAPDLCINCFQTRPGAQL